MLFSNGVCSVKAAQNGAQKPLLNRVFAVRLYLPHLPCKRAQAAYLPRIGGFILLSLCFVYIFAPLVARGYWNGTDAFLSFFPLVLFVAASAGAQRPLHGRANRSGSGSSMKGLPAKLSGTFCIGNNAFI